ncbi:hypothetical protein [Alkaliphilus sp. B6464]|uniref:hypothetical protein n=1 Tax=Alkaliphilus sp. B6464 TaxID=2731219 RepID=UPI001BA65FB2|nr:hypothetical protein [Alkaliphilus sp. B6464]QUH21947.1 hypothetical protein HYG84_18750 [Alkaliphilus sp. B6464]
MKKVYILNENELNELRSHLGKINHDISVVNQNLNNRDVIISYMSHIDENIKKALEVIKD